MGVVALALEDEVASELELSPGQRQKLDQLALDREDEGLELALEIRSLPADQREARLRPFREESEARGLALLTAEQRKLLEAIRVRRRGMASLAEGPLAAKLQLTDAQRQQIDAILADRRKGQTGVNAATAATVQAETERALAGMLTTEQQTAWEAITSGQTAEETPPATDAETPMSPTTEAAASSGGEPVAESAAVEPAAAPAEPGMLRFNFRYQPWQDVLDWFAQQAGLSLMVEAPPPGTFNYVDDRAYTPAEAIDLLNSVLLTKGYTLVRRERMLMLVNLEDGIPPNLVPTITPEELAERGEYELVSVLFDLETFTPEEAEAEIHKFLGPQGSVVALPRSRQVLVTETAGRLRAIRSMIDRVENPGGPASERLHTVDLQFASPDDVLTVVRGLLDIPPDASATLDGSLRLAVDPTGEKLLVTGKPQMVAQVEEIVRALDVPPVDTLASGGAVEMPQLEVYSVADADPASVLAVLQTLLAGMPDVRLATDPKTGALIALARPAEHATIRATLDQLQRDGREVEVFSLRSVDPQLAVLSINKLFGGEQAGGGMAPQVDADPTTRQLLVRGTRVQIDQVRSLLEKMGETGDQGLAAASGGNVRMVPLTGRTARSALERIEAIWPTMSKHRIRVVTPSAVIPTLRPGEDADDRSAPDGAGGTTPDDAALLRRLLERSAIQEVTPSPPSGTQPGPASSGDTLPPPPAEPNGGKATSIHSGPPIRLVAEERALPDAAGRASEPPPIIVAPGPGGIMIACEDLETLNQFEQLLSALASGALAGGPELTVFYLKHAKAADAAEMLDNVLGGGTLASSGGGGSGSLLGDLAGAAFGDAGGGLLGSLLGGGGNQAAAPAGPIKITPDSRLNALVVEAPPADLDLIEQLLKILDQRASPEDLEVIPRAQRIVLHHARVEEVAQIVRQVYQQQLVAEAGQQRPPTPQEFIQMLRGGKGGGGSRGGDESPKMTLSIDARSNALIVAAPEQLFRDVKELVEQLDAAALESADTMRVVTLRRASPEAVERALSILVGDAVQFGHSSGAPVMGRPSPAAAPARGAPGAQPQAGGNSEEAERARRTIDAFRQLRENFRSQNNP